MRIKENIEWEFILPGLLVQQALLYGVDILFIKKIDWIGNTLWGIFLLLSLFLIVGVEN